MTNNLVPLIPNPDKSSGYELFTVMWIGTRGEFHVRLISALNEFSAAKTIVDSIDISSHSQVDVRKTSEPTCFKPKVTV